MRNKRHTRTLPLLLAAALLIGELGATACAAGPPSAGGLCEHHPAHDDACGYIEGVKDTPCGYVCAECGNEPMKDSGEALPKIGVLYGGVNRGATNSDANQNGYHDGDEAAFQAILAAHQESSKLRSVDAKDPASWHTDGLVRWDTDSTPKRITRLFLPDKALTDTLDASGLTALTELNCDSNQLKELNLSGLTALEQLSCCNNLLETLDVEN